MIYLVGSIVFTSYLILAFKFIEKFKANLFQSIVFNYITCVVTGSIVNGSFPVNASAVQANWFPWAMVMGTLFVSLFTLIGITAQRHGVAVASVANKLSLIIPVVIGIFLYRDKLNVGQWMGVAVAIFAVLFVSITSSNNTVAKSKAPSMFLPIVLFVGSGLLDSLLNHVQRSFINESNNNAYLISSFFAAATIGSIILLLQLAKGKQKIEIRSIVAGICVGVPNYFSIWCLVHFLKQSSWGTASIPINNMGIVLFSTLVSALLLKERLSLLNWLGVALSLLSIALIAFY